MNDAPYLIYVPILHTQGEAREIIASIGGRGTENEKSCAFSVVEQEKAIRDMWDGIHAKIQEVNLTYTSVRIFQDALPVCGREGGIAAKLAEKGSRNHQLILELMKKGARLEGTEDPDLLVKEYNYMTQLLEKVSVSHQSYKDALQEYRDKNMKLMEQRDAFIAARIKNTIKAEETPLVFMSLCHQLEKLLKPHFIIDYLIYRLPFKTVRDIYNA